MALIRLCLFYSIKALFPLLIHFMVSKFSAILLSINEIINQMQNPLDFTPIVKVISLKCCTNIRARVNKPILHTGSFRTNVLD